VAAVDHSRPACVWVQVIADTSGKHEQSEGGNGEIASPITAASMLRSYSLAGLVGWS